MTQTDPSSEKELIELAEELFDARKYGEAMERYSQLLSLHPTSSEYNYRYGACLVYAEADKEKAFKHLRFAIGKNDTPVDVHYFLGKAYHLNYQFADALEEYELYKQRTADQRRPKWDVNLAIQQCRNGLNLLSNIKDITVLSKVETSDDEFFRNYDLSDIGGRILVCPEELLSKEDLKSEERFVMFFDGKSSNAFFSSYGKDGDNGRDIYRAVRLPNGNWSKPIPMNRINTSHNDDFPFLHPDGETFYFSSEGHTSMGGYDVFKSKYSENDDSFTAPENLDFAVNSPDDDMLYITDKDHRLAYFASSRSSDQGRMHVYRVEVSANPLELVLLKGKFIPEAPGVSNSARITVSDATTNELIGEYVTDPSNGNYVIDLPHSGRYKFTVDADGSKLAHNGMVEVPSSDEVVAYAQEIKLIESNNIEKLIIKNSFDKPLNTDLYALAQGILKYRAGLDVNYDESKQQKPPVTAGSEVESAYVDAGFAASLSNEEVLGEAREREKKLAEKSEDIRKQMNYAFTLAQQKRQNAAKASRDAEDYLRLADAVGEEDVSRKYLMQAMASRFAAEKLSEESRVALRLSEQLNDRLAEVEQEEQQAQVLAEDVEKAIQAGSYEQMVETMTALKEYEVAQSTDPAYRADEYLLLREQAQERRKTADKESRMAQDLREQENNLTLRIKNRKLQLEAAKNKDKPDIQNEIDVLEDDLSAVQEEIEELFSGMETSQREATWMADQAELYQQIDKDQTDTYIPEEKMVPFNADQVMEMKDQIASVETETAGMEFNLNVVRDILEEESNVAMEAFQNDAQFQEFVKRYDLPKRTGTAKEVPERPDQSAEEIQEEITAANDWIDIIDESVDELQAERAELPEGPRRDSVDQKLSEFQELKYQKVQEIDRAEEALNALDDEATAPYTIAANDIEQEDSGEEEAVAAERATQTIVQSDPIYSEIDPEYEQRVRELAAEEVSPEESLRQKNELDREFLDKLDEAIEPLASKSESQRTQEESNKLARMEIMRDKMAEELAFSENRLAGLEGADRPKTSTEILMEANGLVEEEDELGATKQPVVSRDNIPESIGYDDIDPNYQQALKRVEQSPGSKRDKLSLENDLHEVLVDQIDEKIANYEALSQTADADDKLKIERAISQLQQVKMLKQAEIAENENEMELLRRTAFAREYEVVVEEVDTGYVNKYWAIETSGEAPYFRAVEKAKLEQDIAGKIDTRVDELVDEMDAAEIVEEKDRIQETIQKLQAARQEKVIAYESLYAQAEQLQSDQKDIGTTETTEIAEASQTEREQLGNEEPETEGAPQSDEQQVDGTTADQATAEDDLEQPESVEPDTPTPQVMSPEERELAVDEFIQSESEIVSDLDQYTVFGEVNDMVYNSLNASLEMESIGGDLRRHQNRMHEFVKNNPEGDLNETDREQLNDLLQSELAIQGRIATANRTELEYYRSGNENLIERIDPARPDNLSDDEWTDAVAAQAQANELMTQADELREQAQAAINIKDRLEIQKAAFEREAEAIEVYSRVNRALAQWEDGIPVAYSAAELDAEKVVRRAQPLDETIESARLAVEGSEVGDVTASDEAPEPTEQPESSAERLVDEMGSVDASTFNDALTNHFQLTPERIEQINTQPVYVDWFRKQWLADSLETLRAARFTEAEVLLNDAEAKLVASEEATAEAEAETNPANQRDAYDHAAKLQEEARALFEQARQLREEMGQYSNSAENAREEADALLAGLNDDEAETLTAMAPPRSARVDGPEDQQRDLVETAENTSVETEPAQEDEPATTRETLVETEEAGAAPNQNQPADDGDEPEAEVAEVTSDQPVDNDGETDEETETPRPTDRSLPDVDFSAGIGEVFETTNEPAYSESNPIPIGVEWPDGLVFAVQVGAFRNPIPQDHFSGFSPVRGEVIRDGITRYSAGLFTEFNRANEAKNVIRQKGYSDAFVVAYLNGERIPLNQALDEDQAADIIAAQSGGERTQQQTETTEDPVTPADISERDEFDPGAAVTDYYDDPDAAPAVQVERIRGLFFTVQVGVYSNPVSADDLFNITPLNSEQTSSDYIRYTSGMFPNADFASDHRQIVVNAGVADAFVTAYYNGQRVTMDEARNLLANQGESVLATSPSAVTQEESPSQQRTSEPDEITEETTPERDPRRVEDDESLEGIYADAEDFSPEDIRFIVDLGSFGTGMPQQTADAILQISEAGVTRLELPDGKMHYLSRPTPDYSEAAALREQFIEAGVENVELRAMALGFLLDVEDARRVNNQ